jgi:hypothetical protein
MRHIPIGVRVPTEPEPAPPAPITFAEHLAGLLVAYRFGRQGIARPDCPGAAIRRFMVADLFAAATEVTA